MSNEWHFGHGWEPQDDRPARWVSPVYLTCALAYVAVVVGAVGLVLWVTARFL